MGVASLQAQFTPDVGADLIVQANGQYLTKVAYKLEAGQRHKHLILNIVAPAQDMSEDYFAYLAGFCAWNLKGFFDQIFADTTQYAYWTDYRADQAHWAIVDGRELVADLEVTFLISASSLRYQFKLGDFYRLADSMSMPSLPLQDNLAHQRLRGYQYQISTKRDNQYKLDYVMRSMAGVSRSYFCFMLGVLDTEYHAPHFSRFFPHVPSLPLTLAKVWADDSIQSKAFGREKGDQDLTETYGIIMGTQLLRFESKSSAGNFSFSVSYDELLNDFESF